jgi:transcriptional regulator with XRE-family HTH domain
MKKFNRKEVVMTARENDFDFEDLGPKVKLLRLQHGLTQNKVAEELGVTPGYVSNVENGRTAMSLKILCYYAKLVGLTVDSFVGKIEPEYRSVALDHELQNLIRDMKVEEKERLLKTIKVWFDIE